jgi:hypothetical protein
MAGEPTPGQCAGAILSIFVLHYGLHAGDILRKGTFLSLWSERGYRPRDFKAGLQFAVDRRWLEVLPDGDAYRLTEAGFAAA